MTEIRRGAASTRSVRVRQADGTMKSVYQAQPKQERLHRSTAPNVLYGGQAGGGKSHAARWHAIIGCLLHPGFRALLLRREYTELEQTHILALQLEVPREIGVWKDNKKRLVVPHDDGPDSILQLGHCQYEKDIFAYLSTEWDLIIVDEGSHFTPFMLTMLPSRLRTTKPEIIPQFVVCTNPGGEGHLWLMQRFIDKAPPAEEAPDYDPREWEFIPASVEDNQFIQEEYVHRLERLPEQERQAYRYGNWHIFSGQFFRHRLEQVEAYAVPEWAQIEAGMDWGYDPDPGVIEVAFFDEHGRPRIFRETTFRLKTSAEVAELIHETCTLPGERKMTIRADPSMWIRNPETGVSIADSINDRLAELESEIVLIKANNDRINGWQRVHQYIHPRPQPDGRVEATLKVFQADPRHDYGAPYLVQTMPAQQHHQTRKGDMKDSATDHGCDALRYLLMGRPPLSSLPEHMTAKPTHEQRVHSRSRELLRKAMEQQNRSLESGEVEDVYEGDAGMGAGVADIWS